MIKTKLKSCHHQESGTTLKQDAIRLWTEAKSEIIVGFKNYNYVVGLACVVWIDLHGMSIPNVRSKMILRIDRFN